MPQIRFLQATLHRGRIFQPRERAMVLEQTAREFVESGRAELVTGATPMNGNVARWRDEQRSER